MPGNSTNPNSKTFIPTVKLTVKILISEWDFDTSGKLAAQSGLQDLQHRVNLLCN